MILDRFIINEKVVWDARMLLSVLGLVQKIETAKVKQIILFKW